MSRRQHQARSVPGAFGDKVREPYDDPNQLVPWATAAETLQMTEGALRAAFHRGLVQASRSEGRLFMTRQEVSAVKRDVTRTAWGMNSWERRSTISAERAAVRGMDSREERNLSLRHAFEKALEKKGLEQELIPTAKAERDLLPLVLFNGNKTLGEMQGLWNFSRALQVAEVPTLADAETLASQSEKVRHLCGVHAHHGIYSHRVRTFINRLIHSPAVQKVDPARWDYLSHLWDTQPNQWPLMLEPISRYSPWSKLRWRRPVRRLRPVREMPDRTPMPEVWPFASAEIPQAEAGSDLVMLVDQAVPKTLPEIVRQEVCQDLLLACLEGEIGAENLAGEAGRLTAEIFRRYPIKYGPLSLDAPPPWAREDGRPLIDLLEAS